jgi:foldase protein PrsA
MRRGVWRRLAVVLLSALAVIAGLSACGSGDRGDADPSALAKVNGVAVTRAQVDQVRAEARLAGKDDDAGAALQEAIARELVRQEAKRLGLAVSDKAVADRIAEVTARLGGEAALAEALIAADMTAEQLRAGAEHGLLREKLRDERFGDLKASEAAVRAFYRKHRDDLFTTPAAVRLGDILVRTERLASDLAARIRKGESFAALAKTYSRDAASKDGGGMMGWVQTLTLPDPLRRAAEQADVGGLSGPVQGPGGWFLLKLYGRRPAKVMSFAEAEKELRAELDGLRRTRALDRWIAAERKSADIEVLAP